MVSSGADRAARGLAEDAGVVLAPARAAWRWRVPVCVEVADDGDPLTVDRRVRVVGPAVEELNPAAAAWERAALEEALGSLRPRYFRPAPFTETSRDGEVEVSATARPRRVVWEFSDGVVEVCEGPGVQWSPGAVGPAPCGRDFASTTAGGPPMVLQVRLEYEVGWSSTIGGSGLVAERGEPFRAELVVGEVQAYLTDGLRGPPPALEPLPLPESTQPRNDKDCGGSSFWDCSPKDILDAAKNVAREAWETVGVSLVVAAKQVWEFLQGCAAFVGEVFGSVREMVSQLGQLAADPQKFVDEKLQLARTVLTAVREDAEAFAIEVLGWHGRP